MNKKRLSVQNVGIWALAGLIMVGVLFVTTILALPSRASVEQMPLRSATATPVPGGPGYIMLSPGSFHADTNSSGVYSIDTFGRYIEYQSGDVDVYAPVQLPHGARITQMIYYCRNDAIVWNDAFLLRSSPADYGTASDNVFYAASNASSGDQTIVDTPNEGTDVVDNSRYSYVVHIRLREVGQRAYGVRIDYEYGIFLPAMMKNHTPWRKFMNTLTALHTVSVFQKHQPAHNLQPHQYQPRYWHVYAF